MSSTAPRLFSAMQPTSSSLHLGNYLGALTNWVALQDDYEAIYSVVDLHALTVPRDPETLRAQTRATAAQFLAAGVDTDRSVLFLQSHVAEHARLAWLLSCLTGFGEASRMTQFKDKSARADAESVTVGLFDYPMLMAADILTYDAHLVPVGEDQRQHLELSRVLAARLNSRFGEGTAIVPDGYIVKETAKIYDLQHPEAKMSKSLGGAGVIDILDEPKVITKRIKSAVTDAETVVRFDREAKPGVSNLLTIFSALSGRPIPELEAAYDGKGYGALKTDLAEVVVTALTPIRERTQALLADPAELDRILADGARRARALAEPVYERIAGRMGLLPQAPESRR